MCVVAVGWVMLLTGLRSGDARSMKWENLDQDGVLTVPSPKGGEAKAFKHTIAEVSGSGIG